MTARQRRPICDSVRPAGYFKPVQFKGERQPRGGMHRQYPACNYRVETSRPAVVREKHPGGGAG